MGSVVLPGLMEKAPAATGIAAINRAVFMVDKCNSTALMFVAAWILSSSSFNSRTKREVL